MIHKMKPLLKWVGGKTQIMKDVMAQFPNEFNNYHEPFIGGGSVFLSVLSEVKQGHLKMNGKMFLSDVNADLILFYKTIQLHPKELYNEIVTLFTEYDGCVSVKKGPENRNPQSKEDALKNKESYYYWARHIFNQKNSTPIQRAALFLFLNKTCFRGIHREGPNGFNVPYGHYKKTPQHPDIDTLMEMSYIFVDVIFQHQSFQISLQNIKENDFVYMDPPYYPIDKKSFTSYTSDGFSAEHHQELFQMIKAMKNKFVMSNASVEHVHSEFSNYNISQIECRRAIHSKNPETKVNEVLISNFSS